MPRRQLDFLMAVGSPPWLLILAHLLNEATSVNVLAVRANISQTSLSQHLAKLRKLGLVDIRRYTKWIYYSCNSNAVSELFSTLALRGQHSGAKAPIVAMES
ncbi:metalloregulator ArsR/SmtB family transcription factor [Mesorhizobium sp. M0621]|uniref:ArsR/SmtB family transcription factor n=1 Tax=Mesorhizobium sp. M0621 TaxID=2956974 RepID=UPI00333828BC